MNISLLEILLSVVTLFSAFGIGFIIYIKNRRSATNKLFFLLSLLIDVYIVTNYLSLHPPALTPESQLFWIRMVMVITSFMGPTTLLLVHTFPRERMTLKFWYLIPLVILTAASATASATPLVFKSLAYINAMPIPIPGPAIPIFFLDFVGLFLTSFTILAARYWREQREERKKYLYLLLGVIISFSLTSLFTVIFVVIFQTSQFVFLGPLAPIILIAFIAYAIVKHGLFNIQVIAAEAFTILIWIILFAKIFAVRSIEEALTDGFVFLAIIIFGIFLIRSVTKEVRQREVLEQLSGQLARANSDLKRLDQAKSEFISIASHQLRAPLTVIRGYVSLALEGSFGAVSEKIKEPLKKVEFATIQLIKLVSELLDLSRIESGKIQYKFAAGDIVSVVQGILDEMGPHAKEKGLLLNFQNTVGNHFEYAFDGDKIREVIMNFIDNAIKYSHSGQEIHIRLETVPTQNKKTGDTLRFSVQDNGMGIKKEDLPRLFIKFNRTDEARMRDPNGIGLGLYFVKRIIEDHGGRTWAESEGLEKGSTFFVELPLKK